MEQTKSDSGGIPISDLRPEINRALAVRWFHEVWVERRTETIDELFPPGSIGHTEDGDQGPAEFKAGREGVLKAFLYLHVGCEDTATAAAHSFVRWRAPGTPT